ncbi:DUF6344 domain-containing protein [Streptantibioticus silvisoli]|uniref:DUF6344 domain-containing protein n=1 Tax=Streptantibioticus silvisoli TaxID=2705255 RepID=A0ABT6VV00_9ACTN|nr:DUF6344 domain-containing protein [Streptantibioticus silvisoli]MDI5961990.1 DUF6344 domain-containing protein [Streptantibioticus silvisoli]
MAVTSVTRIRSVILHAFRAILAYFGLATPAAAPRPRAAAPRTAAGLIPAQGRAAAGPYAPDVPRTSAVGRQFAPRSPLARERSLPPTIKQRIRAEAHGSSPSVRRVAQGDDGDEIAAAVSDGMASAAVSAPRRTRDATDR